LKGEIEVITGTGSSIMQMVWVALWYSMDLKFNLSLLHRDPSYYPDLIPVPLTKSKLLDQKLKEFSIKEFASKTVWEDSYTDEVKKQAKILAEAFALNILILGETGTGKDDLAKYIQKNSPLSDRPFHIINCASLYDDNLLSSELFGHELGAFTGALRERVGLFAKCNGGTLFMDEIGEMPMKTQAILLRAIENKEIKRLGSDEVIKDIRVRIIAATNADLWEKCVKKQFRWDLYYRLCDCELELKPFRERSINERNKIIVSIIRESEGKWEEK
jgi:transcriptional regulator with GAF, ATPase, and Fis domain